MCLISDDRKGKTAILFEKWLFFPCDHAQNTVWFRCENICENYMMTRVKKCIFCI